VKGWKKWCIVNAVVGTEDDMLWNDSEEDGDVRSECEEDDGTDWYRWIECDTLCALCVGN
jgi:hypothetical protein